jgi:hypothetical protein
MPSPFGEITFRKIDHQSTLGAYVGKTALKDGKGVMVDSVYRKGADYLRAMRKSKAASEGLSALLPRPLLRGEGRGEGLSHGLTRAWLPQPSVAIEPMSNARRAALTRGYQTSS